MSGPTPEVERDACSVLSTDAGESAYGTAADASSWVCLEQPGPWGRVVASDSHLDPALGGRLDKAVSKAGGRFALIRTPGAHPDDARHPRNRTVLVSSVVGAGWTLRGQLSDSGQLEALDVGALARGDREQVLASMPALAPDPTTYLLLCTNGRRDVCCAVRGRPVALAAAAARPGQVWETSHTGGHRFAPTGVLLPSGATLARLDADLAVTALDAAAHAQLPAVLHGPEHDRGASGLAAPERAAVSMVRQITGEVGLYLLLADPAERIDETVWRVVVRHVDGRSWSMTVSRGVLGPDRPESCAKPAVPQVGWAVTMREGTIFG